MRLLLVEDDPFYGNIIVDILNTKCYAVDWLRNGSDVELALQVCTYDLILLDLSLPGTNGMEVLRNTRSKGYDVPVLIISADPTKLSQVNGLDGGADDYLIKPFDQEEFQARIRALLRRTCKRNNSTITHGSLVMDLNSHEVTFAGALIKIPRREFSVLRVLLNKPGTIFTKKQIEEKLYSWNTEIGSNTVDVHICQLRKKFGSDFIHTFRGVGYKIPFPSK